MEHHFNTEIAKEYGMLEAVIINNFAFWIEKNKANDVNLYDGFYWTYNTMKALSELFIYATERQVRYAINNLIKAEILQTGNYNARKYDRTLWYAFTEKGLQLLKKYGTNLEVEETGTTDKNVNCILQDCKVHLTNLSNGNDEIVKPIPYSKPYNKQQDNKKKKSKEKTLKRFSAPKVEEVRAYCNERKNNIDPEAFIDYYQSKGWTIGKNAPMKDWKAAVRTWERKNFRKGNDYKKEKEPEHREPTDLDLEYIAAVERFNKNL